MQASNCWRGAAACVSLLTPHVGPRLSPICDLRSASHLSSMIVPLATLRSLFYPLPSLLSLHPPSFCHLFGFVNLSVHGAGRRASEGRRAVQPRQGACASRTLLQWPAAGDNARTSVSLGQRALIAFGPARSLRPHGGAWTLQGGAAVEAVPATCRCIPCQPAAPRPCGRQRVLKAGALPYPARPVSS